MIAIAIALCAQIEPHEKALEAARKDPKPVVCFIHRDDWQGEEKTAKGLKEMLGDLAGKVVLAHANVQKNDKLMDFWGIKRADSAFVILDPLARREREQAFARFEKDEGQITPANIKTFVEEGLKQWAEFGAARAAFDVFWTACVKGEFEAFKASLWPAQAKEFGDEKLKTMLEEISGVMKKRESFFHAAVSREEPPAKKKELDPALEASFRVRFVMVDKSGKEDGSSMPAVRTGGKYYIAWTK